MRTKIYITILTLFSAFALNAQVHIITQDQVVFSPESIEVNVGDTIRWEWTSGNHTTTSEAIPPDALIWSSNLTAANPFFEYKITVAGTYTYYCFFHQSMGMDGEIIALNPLKVENDKTKEIDIFPNPAEEFINFQNLDLARVYSVEIFDMFGRQILKTDIDLDMSLNIEDLKSGAYILIINDSEGLVHKQRFMVI